MIKLSMKNGNLSASISTINSDFAYKEIYSNTVSGLSVIVSQSGNVKRIRIRGTLTEELKTNAAYVTIANIGTGKFKIGSLKYVTLGNKQIAVQIVTAINGNVQIGYATTFSGTQTTIESGTGVFIDEFFF